MEGATEELRQVLSTPPPNWQPPTGAPVNSISILHASLEHIRATGDERYLFLRTILEVLNNHGFVGGSTTASVVPAPTPLSGDEEQLLFHCATGLRHVILFRWDMFIPSFRDCVRDFLLSVGLGGLYTSSESNGTLMSSLPRTVSMACLSCAASMWKRGWVNTNSTTISPTDDGQAYLESMMAISLLPSMKRFLVSNDVGAGGAGQQDLFAYLNATISSSFNGSSNQLQRQQYRSAMAASFLSLLVGEFTGGNSSARYNLPLEFHRLCHQVFESGNEDATLSLGVANERRSGLDKTLDLAMSSLSSLVGYILSESSATTDEFLLEMGSSIINVALDVLSWEFGAGGNKLDFSSAKKHGGHGILLRPPQRWRSVLVNPDFLGAMFRVYSTVRDSGVSETYNLSEKRGRVSHQLRQILLQLSSLAGGPIFADENERVAYAGFLLDGCMNALEAIMAEQQQGTEYINKDLIGVEIVDLVTILSRLASNFRIQTLSQISSFPRFLSALCAIGTWILETSLMQCQQLNGDVEAMEGMDWRNDAIAQILQCSDALADDYWIVSGTGGDKATHASQLLATMLAPLYGPYCVCRVQMSSLEDYFISQEEAELDDIREEISALGLEEEMNSAASLGRLNVIASMTTLAGMFKECMSKLLALFTDSERGLEITPVVSALMEEGRMLIVCACHLLTDDCPGETPTIPEAVIRSCKSKDGEQCIASISGLVDLLKSVAEAQAMRVSVNPEGCSPLLAKTLLWFFRRWGTAYVLPSSDDYHQSGGIFGTWSTSENAKPIVSFCTTLCLIYFCHWPQEKEVQDEATSLLLALAKKGSFMRELLVASPPFETIAALHSVGASYRHNASASEVTSALTAFGGSLSPDAVRGYQRLPYIDKARVLTGLLVGSSEIHNDKSKAIFHGCLSAVETSFSSLIQVLE